MSLPARLGHEFRLRADVQSPLDILRSATTVAADLLVVDGDPLEDSSVLADPETHLRAVIQDGRVVVDRR